MHPFLTDVTVKFQAEKITLPCLVEHLTPDECASFFFEDHWQEFFTEKYAIRDIARGVVRFTGNRITFDFNPIKSIGVKSCYMDRYPDEVVKAGVSSVVLVIESPHKDEYEYTIEGEGEYNPPPKTKSEQVLTGITRCAPAQGMTGKKINEKNVISIIKQLRKRDHYAKLRAVLSSVQPNKAGIREFPLILCNPIQFQTSLWAFHRISIGQEVARLLTGPKKVFTAGDIRNLVWMKLWEIKEAQQCFISRITKFHPALIINACTGSLRNKQSLKSHVDQVLRDLPLDYSYLLCHTGHPSYWHIESNKTVRCVKLCNGKS